MEFDTFLYHVVCCLLDVFKEFLVLRYVIGFQPRRKPIILLSAFAIIPIGIGALSMAIPVKYISILYLPLLLVTMQAVIGIWYVKSFLLSVITFVCVCELDFFVAAFLQIFQKEAFYLNANNVTASFISLLIVCIVAGVCKWNDISFYQRNMKHKKEFVVIEILVLFINLGIMGTFFGMLSESSAGSYASILLIVVIMLSLILSVIVLIFYTAIMNVREYRVLHDMNQKQLILQEKHYEQLREIDRKTRKYQHDLKNHFFVLSGFLAENKMEQARNYLEEMTGQFSVVQKVISTGSDIVDVILNEKYRECCEKGISMKEDGVIHAPLIISDYDICTILVNAMDNAVEACERIKGREKWITVSIGIYQEYLHLIVSNSSVNIADLKTRKPDKGKHGIGLENLQECVKRNAGEVTIQTGEGKFVMDVLVKGVAE